MASLKKTSKTTSLLRKLKKILVQRFPAPATVKLEDCFGIIGIVASKEFFGLDYKVRQCLIGDLIKAHLRPEERSQIQIIVAVTPRKGIGYLPSVD